MSLIGGLVRPYEADVHRPNHAGGQVRPYEVDVAFPCTGTMLRYLPTGMMLHHPDHAGE